MAKSQKQLGEVGREEMQDIAEQLWRYLSWHFKQDQGRVFRERRLTWASDENQIPLEVEMADSAMSLLEKCAQNTATWKQVPWRDLLVLMQAFGLSDVKAFHPKYATKEQLSFALDEGKNDAKLRDDATFIRRSQLFFDLAYANGRP